MSEPSVIAKGLRKSYDGVVAVDGVDFAVRAGECFGFLGPNGAGKSSTMKMVYGLASVGGGELRVLGYDVVRDPRAVKARLGVVPQDENLDREFTAYENLFNQGGYHQLGRRVSRARADELLALAGLEERRDALPRELSGGMRRRLLIVRALVGHPQLVVLDEPTTGLDPRARQAVWDTLNRLRGEGVTLLLTTHYMEEATRLCDRLAIMHRGRIADEGAPHELMHRHGEPDLEAVFMHLTGEELD